MGSSEYNELLKLLMQALLSKWRTVEPLSSHACTIMMNAHMRTPNATTSELSAAKKTRQFLL
jgi:hypothetical protein